LLARGWPLLPYVILFAIFAIAAVRTGLNPAQQPGRLAVAVAAAILIIMVGLRFEVGADWFAYRYMLDDIGRRTLAYALVRTDPAYGSVNWIAAQAGWEIWFPNLVCASLFTWGLIALCRQQPNPALALAVAIFLVVVVGMGFTRQSAALGLVMLAIAQHTRGATLRMAISLLFAITFHSSSVIMIPILALLSIRRGIGTVLLVALLAIILVYQFYGSILLLLDRYTTTIFTATGAVPRLLMSAVPALIFLSFRRRLARDAGEVRLWSIFSILALLSVTLLFVVESTTVVDRLGLYLVPLQIVVWSRVPYAFGVRSGPNMTMMFGILTYSFAVLMAWLTIGNYGQVWMPYKNYVTNPVSTRVPPPWMRQWRQWR
jgi:hypothetical protein